MPEEKSFVSFICSTCRQEIEASAAMIGQTVECPACGAKLVVAPQEQSSQAQLDAMKSRTIRIELSDI